MSGMRPVRRLVKLGKGPRDAHKGDFGTVLVLAGSDGMLGAAVLCARAATRSGAGLVRVGLPRALVSLLPLAVPEAMTFARASGDRVAGAAMGVAAMRTLRQQLAAADAVVVGPGMTTQAATRQLVSLVLQHSEVPVVLDADALNVLAPLPRQLSGRPLSCRPLSGRAPIVLTPHPGEAGRLLGVATQDVQADRDAAVLELCQRSGAIVVLKGAETLVADGERCYRNRTGNPGMASGGSGDVLSGMLGAMLARGLAAFDAACLAVHCHGQAGDLACKRQGEHGMVASDIVDAIAKVLQAKGLQ